MPDITMCLGSGCPFKDKCYRHTAKPDEHWQSYFAYVPYSEDGGCNFFWNTDRGNQDER
jgi:hypothetical protein